jgi:hypothetical protein
LSSPSNTGFVLFSSFFPLSSPSSLTQLHPSQDAVKATPAFKCVIEDAGEIEGGPSILAKLIEKLPAPAKTT